LLFIMKGGIAAAAIAALATGANAINRRHAHEVFHNKRVAESDETCGCTTIWETITGEPTRKYCMEPKREGNDGKEVACRHSS
jgi:hypothetical protein